jgi:hypothetical protein
MTVAEFHKGAKVEGTCSACGDGFAFIKGGGGQHIRRCNRCRALQRAFHEADYDLTVERYWELHFAQKGVCAICEEPETARGNHLHPTGVRRLSVDHCHVTGMVRGLLCNGCNRGIGFLGDSFTSVARAAKYLQEVESPGMA